MVAGGGPSTVGMWEYAGSVEIARWEKKSGDRG